MRIVGVGGRLASGNRLQATASGRRFMPSPFSQEVASASQAKPAGSGFKQLKDSVWCPICGRRLQVQTIEGLRKLVCSRHGVMNHAFLEDPRVKAEVT